MPFSLDSPQGVDRAPLSQPPTKDDRPSIAQSEVFSADGTDCFVNAMQRQIFINLALGKPQKRLGVA